MESYSEPVTSSGYEFNHTENQTIGKTAGAAKAWGVVSIIGGVFSLIQVPLTMDTSSGLALIVMLVQGVVAILVGVFFIKTAGALKAVVDTAGNDVAHMMVALQKLGAAFTVQLVAFGASFLIGFVAGIAGATM